jgi:Zn-finger nucleic acid-binding protein
MCMYCRDTRKCPICDGEGGVKMWSEEREELSLIQCPDCEGSGACQVCSKDGTMAHIADRDTP